MFTNHRTHHYAILARKLVKAGRVSLALVVRTTLLVGMVEDIEVVVVNVIAGKDIGDEFQDSVESHTGILNWLPVCAVQAPGQYQVPLLVRTTCIRYWFLPMSGYQ